MAEPSSLSSVDAAAQSLEDAHLHNASLGGDGFGGDGLSPHGLENGDSFEQQGEYLIYRTAAPASVMLETSSNVCVHNTCCEL